MLPKSWSGNTHVLASLDEQTQKQQPARSLTDVGTFLAGGAAALLPGEGNEARSRALKMKRSVGPPGLSRAASRGEAFSSKCMGDLHKSLYTLRPSSWAAELPGDSFSSCTYATRLSQPYLSLLQCELALRSAAFAALSSLATIVDRVDTSAQPDRPVNCFL